MASAKSDKPKAKTKTIIDVTHADSSPPSPNSKSVIVPSRPILKDPMVTDETEEKPVPIKVSREKQIDTGSKAPSIAELAAVAAAESADKTEEKAEGKPADKPAKKTDDEPAAEKTIEPPAKEESEDKPDEKPEPVEKPEEKAPDDKPADEPQEDQPDEAKTTDKEQAAKAAEEAKHDEAVAKMVESKQYYLPINTIEKRRSKRFVALGILLSLLLVLAWADIALDAQLIHVSGVKPVTHFFSN